MVVSTVYCSDGYHNPENNRVADPEILTVEITYEQPLSLADLTLAMLDLSRQYESFLQREVELDSTVDTNLYVQEVRSGSIIFELISHGIAALPLLWDQGAIPQFVVHLQLMMNWLLGKVKEQPIIPTKSDYSQLHTILEPIAKDQAAQLNITAKAKTQTFNTLVINSADANIAQNQIRQRMAEIDTPQEHQYTKRMLQWHQTKFDAQSDTGDKAIIESISKKPVKVIFVNNGTKEGMLHSGDAHNKPWQELAYVVDVEVQFISDQPRLYTINDYYPDDTFDPDY